MQIGINTITHFLLEDIADLKMYKRYLNDFKRAAEESVRYAEWSIFWIKYKNCQYDTNEGYCADLSNWKKHCYMKLNPFVSSVTCSIRFVGYNKDCSLRPFENKCSDPDQRGLRNDPDWERNRWSKGSCWGNPWTCSNRKGNAMWREVGAYFILFCKKSILESCESSRKDF